VKNLHYTAKNYGITCSILEKIKIVKRKISMRLPSFVSLRTGSTECERLAMTGEKKKMKENLRD